LTRPVFLALMFEGKPLTELVEAGQIQLEGDPSAFGQLAGAAVEFDPTFSLVTPPPPPADGGNGQEMLPPIQSGD
jgi:alkyl sulfatase BDS1-like metallo-beta-lactamase superfamily hydrolase